MNYRLTTREQSGRTCRDFASEAFSELQAAMEPAKPLRRNQQFYWQGFASAKYPEEKLRRFDIEDGHHQSHWVH